jgi:hypothetical protein
MISEPFIPRSRDSSVGVVTGYGLDGTGSIPGVAKICSSPTLWSTQPPVHWVAGALSPGVKRLGHVGDHSPASSAELSNGGSIPPLPHLSLWHNV